MSQFDSTKSKFERAPYPEHPHRCQALGGQGQCPFLAVKDDSGNYQKYCPRHGGNRELIKQRTEDARLYMAAQWRDRIKNYAEHPRVKSLREEIGILRMTLDTKLGAIKDNHDLMLQAQGITNLVREIRETVVKAQAIEQQMGQTLDHAQATSLIQEIIRHVTEYIQDPDILQFLSEDMMESLDRITKKGN